VGGGEILERYSSKGRLDMEPNDLLIPHESALPHRVLGGVVEPPVEVLTYGLIPGVKYESALAVGESLSQLGCRLGPGLAVENLRLTPLRTTSLGPSGRFDTSRAIS
jgi:hypothetical protein